MHPRSTLVYSNFNHHHLCCIILRYTICQERHYNHSMLYVIFHTLNIYIVKNPLYHCGLNAIYILLFVYQILVYCWAFIYTVCVCVCVGVWLQCNATQSRNRHWDTAEGYMRQRFCNKMFVSSELSQEFCLIERPVRETLGTLQWVQVYVWEQLQ